MNILAHIRNRFASVLATLTDDASTYLAMIRTTQDPRFGDFQANFAMALAKRKRMNPRELATRIAEQLDLADCCEKPEVAGPGFINIRLRNDWLLRQTNGLITDDRLGEAVAKTSRRVVVDYSSPNVAKPMHVGHLRSTVIGDAICRILRFQGHDVIADNHIGDWGTQFGMILYGYKNFLDAGEYQRDPVMELARLYKLVNQLSGYHAACNELPGLRETLAVTESNLKEAESEAKPGDKSRKTLLKKLRSELAETREKIEAKQQEIDAVQTDASLKSLAEQHPNIAEAARRETAKLHAGDAENQALWEEFLPECLKMLDTIYDRLNIQFDRTLGESFYNSMLSQTAESLREKGLVRESEGALCVFIEGNDAPFIVRKTDGAFTYATTDLACVRYRCEELKADEVLYVVDKRQSEHFQLLFETSRQWGYGQAAFRHVSFGTVMGDDGKPFKTRAGDLVGLESLLNAAVDRARRIVDQNDDAKPNGPELDEATRAAVAEIVGIGGIKYADLHHNRDSDYVFNWDKMLATTGDTATYLQYAYARISGIFRKGRIDRDALRQSGVRIQFTHASERALAFQLNRFSDALAAVTAEYRPNILAQYLFQTANLFSTLYDQCPVLKAEDETIRSSRLLLCDLTARVLNLGLSLLGIETCEQM